MFAAEGWLAHWCAASAASRPVPANNNGTYSQLCVGPGALLGGPLWCQLLCYCCCPAVIAAVVLVVGAEVGAQFGLDSPLGGLGTCSGVQGKKRPIGFGKPILAHSVSGRLLSNGGRVVGTRACLALVGAKGAHRSWWSCTVNRPILVPRNDVPALVRSPFHLPVGELSPSIISFWMGRVG